RIPPLDEKGGHALFQIRETGEPRSRASELVEGQKLVARSFETDVHAAVLEAGFLGVDLVAPGEILNAHAQGEIDDLHGRPGVHTIVPWHDTLPALVGEFEGSRDAIPRDLDVLHLGWVEGG